MVSAFCILLFCSNFAFANDSDSVKIISVSKCKPGESLPIFVDFTDFNGDDNNYINGTFNLVTTGNTILDDNVGVKYGKGLVLSQVLLETDFTISVEGYNGAKQVVVEQDIPQINLSGSVGMDTYLENTSDYYLYEDLVINENVTLTVEAGTRVFIGEDVNIIVHGILSIEGTQLEPILFSAIDQNKAWGGINILNSNIEDSSRITYAFINRAGGNSDFVFGHSNSQAVIKCENSNLIVSNCYITDNEGKCFGSTNSNLKILDSYITRSDLGGEFIQSIVNAKNVYVVDIPDGDHIIADDDNDGFYFNAVHPSGNSSIVDSCIFVTGEDDAIDHNGAKLEIRNCIIDDFNHEGIAASNSNSVFVFNTLIKDCEQGIEAGYGNPLVNIEHCVLIDNGVGVRFGDNYNWGCTGEINIINSISYNNTDNFKNFDILTGGPVSDAINVSYCMTNDIEYDNYPYCIVGNPIFEQDYFLAQNSPGRGMASTGLDLGLYNPLSKVERNVFGDSCLNIYPNPVQDMVNIHYYSINSAQLKLVVTDIFGCKITELKTRQSAIGNNQIQFNIESFASGMYFVCFYSNDVLLKTEKMIVE